MYDAQLRVNTKKKLRDCLGDEMKSHRAATIQRELSALMDRLTPQYVAACVMKAAETENRDWADLATDTVLSNTDLDTPVEPRGQSIRERVTQLMPYDDVVLHTWPTGSDDHTDVYVTWDSEPIEPARGALHCLAALLCVK